VRSLRFQQHKGGPGDVSEPGPRTFEQADPHYSNTWCSRVE